MPPTNSPTKLSKPDQMVACTSFSVPVQTTIATALEVSWRPFVASNASAMTKYAASMATMAPEAGVK